MVTWLFASWDTQECWRQYESEHWVISGDLHSRWVLFVASYFLRQQAVEGSHSQSIWNRLMGRRGASASNRSPRHWQITIFCSISPNNCFIIRSPILLFNHVLFHERAVTRRRKAWFNLLMSRILFAAKHNWAILRMSRPLFVASYLQVTWWVLGQWKGRKICFEW